MILKLFLKHAKCIKVAEDLGLFDFLAVFAAAVDAVAVSVVVVALADAEVNAVAAEVDVEESEGRGAIKNLIYNLFFGELKTPSSSLQNICL